MDSVVSLTGNRIIHFHRVLMATLRTRLTMNTKINKYVYLAMTLQEIIKEKSTFHWKHSFTNDFGALIPVNIKHGLCYYQIKHCHVIQSYDLIKVNIIIKIFVCNKKREESYGNVFLIYFSRDERVMGKLGKRKQSFITYIYYWDTWGAQMVENWIHGFT